MSMYKVGIVGAGRVGQRRAATAHAHPASTVALIYDDRTAAAAELAAACGAAVAASREELIAADIDVAVVSTTHDALAPISTAALLAGKHVLCEKPLGRNPREARPAVAAAERSGRVLKVGYNHRYHPAIQKLHTVCTAGEIGPAAEHPGALWPRRAARLRPRVADPSREGGRRRAFRPRGASNRLGQVALGGLCRSHRLCRDPFLGLARGGQRLRTLSHGHRTDRLATRELDPVEKTSSALRFSGAMAMSVPRV